MVVAAKSLNKDFVFIQNTNTSIFNGPNKEALRVSGRILTFQQTIKKYRFH